MGYDPTGYWDWGGVLTGIVILLGTAASVATFGITSMEGAVATAAAATTGTAMIYAAATDSTMVVDISYSYQVSTDSYAKMGGSVVIDFENDNANFYSHMGGGKGYSSGFSYSVGFVDNYDSPDDYERHFVDVNGGLNMGFDHCWNPEDNHDMATQATSLTFSTGLSYGLGYDYYFSPIELFKW